MKLANLNPHAVAALRLALREAELSASAARNDVVSKRAQLRAAEATVARAQERAAGLRLSLAEVGLTL